MQPPAALGSASIGLTMSSGSLVGSSRPSSWRMESIAAAADCSKGVARRPLPSSSRKKQQSDMGLHAMGLEGALGPARSARGERRWTVENMVLARGLEAWGSWGDDAGAAAIA